MCGAKSRDARRRAESEYDLAFGSAAFVPVDDPVEAFALVEVSCGPHVGERTVTGPRISVLLERGSPPSPSFSYALKEACLVT